MVTAYDAPAARIADDAGVDMILVGDSLAMVVLGYDDTLQVTIDDMAHHIGAVARAKPRALVVGDLPWLSYHVSVEDDRAQRRHARSGPAPQAVKLEGGRKRLAVGRGDPRRRDPGDGPPRPHARSRCTPWAGSRCRASSSRPRCALVDDAEALADAGCFAIVLEGVPDEVARMVTDAGRRARRSASAPGRHCDGQVLVFHDLLGIEDRDRAEVRAPLRRRSRPTPSRPSSAFAADVRAGRFPASDETYHLADDVAEALGLYGAAPRVTRLAGQERWRYSWRWPLLSSEAGCCSCCAGTTRRPRRAARWDRCSPAPLRRRRRSRASPRCVWGSAGTAGTSWSPTTRTNA